ncbi:hypothetical protein [Parachlamydia sp. AcF125]|uniref:hypothetical protein n=1 Tax=Parachlamydia sp. AcF125 TaxID=2795736 RepID=UPI001BC9BC09|nr:hypothetical protein [Parachlamydia sp. AcF125]
MKSVFKASKGEIGLDHYEARSYTGWYRHMALCLVALRFLSAFRQVFNQVVEKKSDQAAYGKVFKSAPFNLICYTLQEVRHLLNYVQKPIKQAWSYWLEWSTR